VLPKKALPVIVVRFGSDILSGISVRLAHSLNVAPRKPSPALERDGGMKLAGIEFTCEPVNVLRRKYVPTAVVVCGSQLSGIVVIPLPLNA